MSAAKATEAETVTGILIRTSRLRSSASGNPRYSLTLRTGRTDMTTSTAPNSFAGYTIQGLRIGTMVTAVIQKRGVISIEEARPEEVAF